METSHVFALVAFMVLLVSISLPVCLSHVRITALARIIAVPIYAFVYFRSLAETVNCAVDVSRIRASMEASAPL